MITIHHAQDVTAWVEEDGITLPTWYYAYATGKYKPHYPVPAIRSRTFEYWRNLGEVSALNGFDIEVVQAMHRYR